MYAKLFSRITESSLMEEEIDIRYTFVMLLAIADPKGYVIGTDVAIARRLNMDVDHFRQCIGELMKPDPDSNSKEEEGRRVVVSDWERGYRCVNYMTYRNAKDEDHRREYMKEYMRKYRGGKQDVNTGKHSLVQAAASASASVSSQRESREREFKLFWDAYPKHKAKQDAVKAFAKLKEDDRIEDLLVAIQWQKQTKDWLKDGGQFIPLPASWLNARRWEDEPPMSMVTQVPLADWSEAVAIQDEEDQGNIELLRARASR